MAPRVSPGATGSSVTTAFDSVDVGTIPEIHAQIRRLAEEGKAVVVISSYLPEVLSISDRILVARLGRIVAEFDAASATEDKIMYAAIH